MAYSVFYHPSTKKQPPGIFCRGAFPALCVGSVRESLGGVRLQPVRQVIHRQPTGVAVRAVRLPRDLRRLSQQHLRTSVAVHLHAGAVVQAQGAPDHQHLIHCHLLLPLKRDGHCTLLWVVPRSSSPRRLGIFTTPARFAIGRIFLALGKNCRWAGIGDKTRGIFVLSPRARKRRPPILWGAPFY